MQVTAATCPVADPRVVLREDFDDWAVLFDPRTGSAVGLNPTGVAIWKLLDGRRTLAEVAAELPKHIDGVPPDALEQTLQYVSALAGQGFVAGPAAPDGPAG